ncbi:MAG: alcohol dehydrogenase, partial [Saprospiraceae bacterium]|nr:alcohol dehydrogenase [Saprospiraceae bacterium]
MNALYFRKLNEPLSYEKTLVPKPTNGEVVVHLRAAALNYRDIWITQGQYAQIRQDVILGSDGAGEYKGKQVIINPSIHWGDNPHAQGKNFHILG